MTVQYRAKVYEHFRFSVDFGQFRLTLSMRHTVKNFYTALKIFGHIKHSSSFIFVVDNFFVSPLSRQIELVQIYYLRNSPFSVENLAISRVLHWTSCICRVSGGTKKLSTAKMKFELGLKHPKIFRAVEKFLTVWRMLKVS